MFKPFLSLDKLLPKSLTFLSKKNFPRFVPTIKKSLNQDQIDKEKEEEEKIEVKRIDFSKDFKERDRAMKDFYQAKEASSEEREELLDENFKLYKMAHCSTSIMEMPFNLQAMAKKIFSKHLAQDVREWSRKYLIRQGQNHSCEPPINLNIVSKPFANSNEIDVKIKIFNKEEAQINSTIEVKEEPDVLGTKPKSEPDDTINPIKFEYEKAHSIAYLHSRMPFTFGTMKKILHELTLRMPEFKPNSVLDYGAGLGSGVLAAHDEFPSLEKLAAVEPNRNMRRLGKMLTSYTEKQILWVDSITMIPGTGVDRGKFDLILLSHVLQEIPTANLRRMIIETLWNRVTPNGVFVIVEPGSPKGFRFIHDLRSWAINKDRSEASLIAPCSNHLKCPLAENSNDWCHFSQIMNKFNKQVFPKLKAEKSLHNEKFSYLVIKKGKTPNVTLTKEEEAKIPEEKSFFWHRVIRPNIKKHAHIIVDVCTSEGQLERRIVSKSHGKEGGYKTAKRTKWGDLWYLPRWIPNKYRKENKKGKRLW